MVGDSVKLFGNFTSSLGLTWTPLVCGVITPVKEVRSNPDRSTRLETLGDCMSGSKITTWPKLFVVDCLSLARRVGKIVQCGTSGSTKSRILQV